jgi:hypothetical protein
MDFIEHVYLSSNGKYKNKQQFIRQIQSWCRIIHVVKQLLPGRTSPSNIIWEDGRVFTSFAAFGLLISRSLEFA